MATLTLRPVSDSSLGHSCSSGSSGYSMLVEASADDDSTYIYQQISSTSSTSASSAFKVSGSTSKKVKISSLQVYVRARCSKANSNDTGSMTYNISVNGTSGSQGSATLTTSYADSNKTFSASSLGIADTVFDSFSAAEIVVTVGTSGNKYQSKNDNFQNRITQVYVVATYEEVEDASHTGFYVKIGGSYQEVKTVYKKVGGVYIAQTDISSAFDTGAKYVLGT